MLKDIFCLVNIGAMMVTIGMNYKVLPEKKEVFERAFNSVLDAMKQMEGHRTSSLYVDTNENNSYLIVSDWESEQKFKEFISSDQFKKVTNWGKEQILAGRPSHTVYQH